MPDVDQKTNDVAVAPDEKWRVDLLKAKAAGADDESAAQFAGLTREQLEQHLINDPTLEVDMLKARAKALLTHLKWIQKATQWQAHEFLLLRMWPDVFSQGKLDPANPLIHELRTVVRTMRPDQLRRVPLLLAEGIRQDNEKCAAQLSTPDSPVDRSQCSTTETTSSTPSAS